MNNNTLIFVALSGGVDSSVVLQLLKEKYQNIQGISHIVWPESLCCTTECLDQCAWQCQQAGVPYENIDCIQEFSQKVIDPFVQNYFDGITPNPCVLCNQYIRFDLMIEEFFKRHPEKRTDNYKLATGHYAQIEERDGYYYLKKGTDHLKDQAFVLYRLSQNQLKHCLFPLGGMTKPEVRALAGNMSLTTATKKDSMGACFAGDDYRDFIREYSGKKIEPGNFVDLNGAVLGRHQGYQFYTRGQRRGLGLSGGPWYVLEVRPQTNEVVLSHGKENLLLSEFYVENLVWHYPEKKITKATVQTRHHAPELKCALQYLEDDLIKVTLEKPYAEISAGQSAVFYDGEYVMGGGVIRI